VLPVRSSRVPRRSHRIASRKGLVAPGLPTRPSCAVAVVSRVLYRVRFPPSPARAWDCWRTAEAPASAGPHSGPITYPRSSAKSPREVHLTALAVDGSARCRQDRTLGSDARRMQADKAAISNEPAEFEEPSLRRSGPDLWLLAGHWQVPLTTASDHCMRSSSCR
jgi:hypothetical protein